MKAVLIIPIESLRGKLREDGYYFRVYRGGTDRAEMSAEMGGHTGSEGSTGAVCGEVRKEESAELKSREQDEENAGKQTKRHRNAG